MKYFIVAIALLFQAIPMLANHITGGEIFYTYAGLDGNGNHQYHVTLKLYRDHNSTGAQLDGAAAIAVFNTSSGAMVWNNSINMTRQTRLILGSPGPCITNAPVVDYDVGYYEFDLSLPPAPGGYTITYQRCCRIAGINNLSSSSSVGATYTAIIPGTTARPDGPINNSARFTGADTVIVCGGYPFTYSFAAIDPDPTDQLTYSFCDAFIGGGTGQGTGTNGAQPNPPAGPPYSAVPYAFPYSGFSPLGPGVSINSATGLITGMAPAQGIYVVTVCVNEIRNGVVIATQRKDLQIKAGDCDVASATLNPQYITCDGFTMDFFNLSNSPLINSYFWDFGDPASGANNTSTSSTPTHTFSVAGDYTIKLVTNRGQECSDSTTAIVKVWPGFFPAFTSTGICLRNPVLFNDATTTNYGFVDSWRWNFGDLTTLADTSRLQNSTWTYADTGSKAITLIVTNSKGCIDTLTDTVHIIDRPPITLAFRDTLICVPDAVQLQASGTGIFSWSPSISIVNANTATPTVNPVSTTTYYVQLDEQGCINTDSVRIRVVNFVTLNEMPDTTICQTDTAQLRISSDGLQYSWTPASAFVDATVQNPVAIAGTTALYTVTARIGSCSATRNIQVTAIPYPVANAGPDTIICYSHPAFLHGSHDGNSFTWSPAGSLINPNTLNPTAFPSRTTQYVLSVLANRGCPKPGRDTVFITVMPKINPYAGNDTLVVVGQPLQLNAEGGVSYQWIPPTGLNNAFIKNPIGIYPAEIDSVLYTVLVYDSIGCVDSAFVNVTVFKTNPYVFVPSGFTPNGDGLNDVLRPIAVGVKEIKYFAVYNRWGQLLFRTSINGHGWDGRIGGALQGTNVFVWMVSAVDYLDKPVFLKGTTTLIR
ncbi:MAG: gliding motility-associated C-terminal domain-containing protein [Chitinophagaceae bacterium]|nr:gliding motility-associated C-terminal domain-containing protein [Chitinophagaceae bacterium]